MMKERLLRQVCLAILLGVVSSAFGCGGSKEPTGPSGTVTGKVTFKGMPLAAGCTVLFQPSAKGGGASSSGALSNDGSYTLQSVGKDKIPVGSYVAYLIPPPPKEMDPQTLEKYMQTNDPNLVPKAPPVPFPAKYADASTSGLKFDVKEGPNTIDITLVE